MYGTQLLYHMSGKRNILFFLLFTVFFPAIFPAVLTAQKKTYTVVIDAGHGGKDPGAMANGVKEKDITLAVALKTGKYIEEKTGAKVVYTRKTDIFVPLKKRASIANRSGADIFISIHCNANRSSRPAGAETYVLGLHRTQDNLEVAKKENAAIFYEEDYKETYEGFDPNNDEDYIILTLLQNVNLEKSIEIGNKIQEQFEKRVGRKNRGVKQAGFLVLRETTMTGVLIELGFLSNKEEARFLKSEKGQDYMASAIYRAVRDHLKELEQEDAETEDPALQLRQELAKDTVYYRVQFAGYKKKKKKNYRKFRKLKDVRYYVDNGLYKYTSGNDTSYKAMLKWKDEVRRLGFKDAFVVAFKNGKRISLKEALKNK